MSLVNYSQCWEDTQVLKKALAVKGDDVVLSITSGGDNTFSLLLEKPRTVVSIDKNPVQNYLAELKLRAAQVLRHPEYLEFLGVVESDMRYEQYGRVSKHASADTGGWINANPGVLKRGIIHCGKFEKYLYHFRERLLPLVHARQTVHAFVTQPSMEEQISFYETIWNTWRWRLFMRIATNRSLLTTYARQSGAPGYTDAPNESYRAQLERLTYRSHLKRNYYVRYTLTGAYGEVLPEYLSEENYAQLSAIEPSACEFSHCDLLSYLRSSADNTFTKYNLSNTFEYLSRYDIPDVWREIIRTAKQGAVVAYWCNRVEHVPPPAIAHIVVQQRELEQELKALDRLYFYKSFHVCTIDK